MQVSAVQDKVKATQAVLKDVRTIFAEAAAKTRQERAAANLGAPKAAPKVRVRGKGTKV